MIISLGWLVVGFCLGTLLGVAAGRRVGRDQALQQATALCVCVASDYEKGSSEHHTALRCAHCCAIALLGPDAPRKDKLEAEFGVWKLDKNSR
jgi:hypothetical protein